jgi:hypothetical protein
MTQPVYFYSLDCLVKAINIYPNNRMIHTRLLERYKGLDWIFYTRYVSKLSCSRIVCSSPYRKLTLIGMSPNVSYSLKNVENISILAGYGSFDYQNEKEITGTHLIENQKLFVNGHRNTALLCFTKTIDSF